MYSLQDYLNTSADDAKMTLNNVLRNDPKQALLMANKIIAATSSRSNKKTLHKTACTIKSKAEKVIREVDL